MIKLIKKAYTRHLDGLVEKYWQIYKFDMNPNHTSHNNEGDAFKHCMFQAELTFWLGERIAKFFGDMHEDKPDNPEITDRKYLELICLYLGYERLYLGTFELDHFKRFILSLLIDLYKETIKISSKERLNQQVKALFEGEE